jgi:hypothetical protein
MKKIMKKILLSLFFLMLIGLNYGYSQLCVGFIGGDETTCLGINHYCIPENVPGATYQWVISPPAGGTITAGQGTTNITVDWTIVGLYTLTVTRTTQYGCISSTFINVTVLQNLPVSVTIVGTPNPLCAGAPITFTATPVNGGSSPTYQWQVQTGGVGPFNNVGGNSPIYTYVPTNGDVVRCILTSNAPCATGSPATSNTVVVVIDPAPALGPIEHD